MSRFKLLLHDGPDTPPIVEPLDADSEEDARDLAKVRLLLTRDYTHVHIYKGDAQIAEFRRTSVDTGGWEAR